MKKVSFIGKTKEELADALMKELATVRGYKSSVAKKGSLKEYRASRKAIARIKTEMTAVDKK